LHVAPVKRAAPSRAKQLRWLPGLQLGGSGYAQLVMRYAGFAYLQPEVGFGVMPGAFALNGSAGLVSELRFKSGLAPYLGAAYGFGLAGGSDEEGSRSALTSFGSARLGAALYFGAPGAMQRVGLDGGVWVGRLYDERDGVTESRRLLWPMAGLSWHAEL
jgi:hypothetical protein